jgi:hypothetical protein
LEFPERLETRGRNTTLKWPTTKHPQGRRFGDGQNVELYKGHKWDCESLEEGKVRTNPTNI